MAIVDTTNVFIPEARVFYRGNKTTVPTAGFTTAGGGVAINKVNNASTAISAGGTWDDGSN